jgi:ribokinase
VLTPERHVTVVVLGSANLDLTLRVARIPRPGETLLATSAVQHPGGKGNNQVIAVARAGAQVDFIAAIGKDAAGDLLVSTFREAGVGDRTRRVGQPTGTALIMVEDSGENAIVVNSGSNGTLVSLTSTERRAIAGADYLLLQLEIPLSAVIEAVVCAAAAGTRVVLNASPIRELPDELLRHVDVLLINEHEALIVASAMWPDRAWPRKLTAVEAAGLATHLVEEVAGVVITLGSDGAVVFSREMTANGPAHIPAAKVTAIDTTGAGDAFSGALVAAMSRGENLVVAVVFASAAAALAVQQNGAVPSIPMRADIEEFRDPQCSGA